MGDMAEDMRALKEHHRERRSRNTRGANKRLDELEAIGVKMLRNDAHTWLLELAGKKISYWPPSGKWQWAGKVMAGGFDAFLGFAKKRMEKYDRAIVAEADKQQAAQSKAKLPPNWSDTPTDREVPWDKD